MPYKYIEKVREANRKSYHKRRKFQNALALVGKKRGELLVLEFLGHQYINKRYRSYYLVQCSCGNKIERRADTLSKAKNCGNCNQYKFNNSSLTDVFHKYKRRCLKKTFKIYSN